MHLVTGSSIVTRNPFLLQCLHGSVREVVENCLVEGVPQCVVTFPQPYAVEHRQQHTSHSVVVAPLLRLHLVKHDGLSNEGKLPLPQCLHVGTCATWHIQAILLNCLNQLLKCFDFRILKIVYLQLDYLKDYI